MPRVYENVSSLFKKNGTIHIDDVNAQFGAMVDEMIYQEAPEIREYEEKVGKKMKLLVTTNHSTSENALDIGKYRACGGLAETYKPFGLKSRADFVGRFVVDHICMSNGGWKKAADDIIQDRWPTSGIMSGYTRTAKSRIPKVYDMNPVVVDGKMCIVVICVNLSEWPDKEPWSEFWCAMRLIEIFKDKIASSDSSRQFAEANLREYITVDYPRKYVWNSSLFTVKNTFLEFSSLDDENLDVIGRPSLWSKESREKCVRKRTAWTMDLPTPVKLNIARLCADHKLKTMIPLCDILATPSRKEGDMGKSQGGDMVGESSASSHDIPRWQSKGYGGEYGYHGDPYSTTTGNCDLGTIIHAPGGEETYGHSAHSEVCQLSPRWHPKNHRAMSLPEQPFSLWNPATREEKGLSSFKGGHRHHTPQQHMHTLQGAASVIPPTSKLKEKYRSECANKWHCNEEVTPCSWDEYCWRTSTVGSLGEKKVTNGTQSAAFQESYHHTGASDYFPHSLKEYMSTPSGKWEAPPWGNPQESHPQSELSSSSGRPSGFPHTTNNAYHNGFDAINREQQATSIEPDYSGSTWGAFSWPCTSPPNEEYRRSYGKEYHRHGHGSSVSAGVTEPMESSSSTDVFSDPSSYSRYIEREKTPRLPPPTQRDEGINKRQPVLSQRHQKVNGASSVTPPSALREYDDVVTHTINKRASSVTAPGATPPTDLYAQEPRHRAGTQREEHCQNRMPITNESTLGPNGKKPITQPKKKKPSEFFRPGDRVVLHSFETTHWLEGLTGKVKKVMTESRTNGQKRIRVQIAYDNSMLAQTEHYYPSTIPLRNVRHI